MVCFAIVSVLFSCKKEPLCDNCPGANKSPVAVAGNDQTITFPVDSLSLDGSASHDPEGSIVNYKWTKISGPASFRIINASAIKTTVKNLVEGLYVFELKVTDNDGVTAKDSIKVSVYKTAQHPRAPVANAGKDRIILLPTNFTNLDGSGSMDPDQNIISWQWTKTGGPNTFIITESKSVQTTVVSLVQGIYEIELKVTDAEGLFSTDSVRIVVEANPAISCENGERPFLFPQLKPFNTLSKPRYGAAVGSVSGKLVFAGGRSGPCNGPGCEEGGSSRVDIFDLQLKTRTTAELSKARFGIAAVDGGNKIYFAGGVKSEGSFKTTYSDIDVFDATSNTWSVLNLSTPRSHVAAGVLTGSYLVNTDVVMGNRFLFAGGYTNMDEYTATDKIDIYNETIKTWSSATLSQARGNILASTNRTTSIINGVPVTSTGGIIFAGDHKGGRTPDPSNRIDLYNSLFNTWPYMNFREPMGFIAGLQVRDKFYSAAGCMVEIIDFSKSTSIMNQLSQPGAWSAAEGQHAVLKDDKIVFFTGSKDRNEFDVFDIPTQTWYVGILPDNKTISQATIFAVDDTIYIAGGYVNGVLSDQVWTLDF